MKKYLLLLWILSGCSFHLIAQLSWQQGQQNGRISRYRLDGNKSIPEKKNLLNTYNYTWKWDTIISYDASLRMYQRVSRSYNSFGYPLTQLTEQWQNNAMWVNYSRQTWTYDSAGNLPYQTNLIELWQNNEWENSENRILTFNNNGDQLSFVLTMWDSIGWSNIWFYSYKYDSNGLVDSCIFQEGQGTTWVNSKLWLPTYDVNGLITSEVTDTWTNNTWTITNLDTYTFDVNGNMLSYLYQNWVNSLWENNCLQTYSYDIYGNPSLYMLQFWLNNAWKNMTQSFYTFNLSGKMLNEIDQLWSNNAWENSLQTIYSYDTSNNMTSRTSQNWAYTSWENQNKAEYTYDSAGNSITGKNLIWNPNQSRWIPNVSGLIVFSNHQNDDYITSLIGHRYSMIVDSIFVNTDPIITNCRFSVFPNPGRSIIYVTAEPSANNQSGSITVYNLQGEIVLFEHMKSPSMQIDISGLLSGLYFVRYTNNREVRTVKLVKV
jgi:hypothetical protein